MQPWPIPLNANFRMPISADYRHAEIDYLNDVTWELVSGGGEPAALSIQTTAGLRMRALRFFPRIVVGQTTRCDPREFEQAPSITRLSPGSLTVKAEPAAGLRVRMDVTVCTSQTISGRLLWHNSSAKEMDFTLEWVGQLSPLGEGEPMSAQVNGVHTALFGRSGELQPVCFLTGGAYGGEGVYPALALDIHLAAGETREVTWACALLTDAEESFDHARQLTSRAWDGEIARIDMGDIAALLEVESGDPDWDRAFLLAQREAQRLLLTGSSLPYPSFVLSRQPDQGFSLQSSGSDFPPAWSGQTALDAWQISGSLLPGSHESVLGLLRNFLSVQTEEDSIDWRPGLAGQRSRHLAQPMLASLADRIGGDETGELFGGLLRFYEHWFSSNWDRDGDGFPEWEHAVQTGLEDAPIYDRWNPDGHGVDIRSLEAPGLAALLLREGLSLREMARRIGTEEQAALLTVRCQRLQQALDETWDAAAGTFRYRDPATHLSPGPITLVEMDAAGVQRLRMPPGVPRRLVLRVEAVPGERTRPLHVTITGKGEDGDVEEEIPSGRIHWARNVGRFTTRNVFTQVEQVRVAGLLPGDRVKLIGADASREDVSLLLPLWAGACSAQQAAEMVERCFPRYMSRFGLRLWPGGKAVHPGWNQLIGEGLIQAGQEFAALNLLERLMTAVVPCVLSNGRFAEAYDAETGAPLGESAALHGLAPLGLFLQVLGIQQLGTNLLVWRGKSVFPRPVKLQYRGMKLIIDHEQVRVSFTNGQQVTVDGPGAQRVFLG